MEGTKREDMKEKRRNTRGRDLQKHMVVQVKFMMKMKINGQERKTARNIVNDIKVQWTIQMKLKKIGLKPTGIAVIAENQKRY